MEEFNNSAQVFHKIRPRTNKQESRKKDGALFSVRSIFEMLSDNNIHLVWFEEI